MLLDSEIQLIMKPLVDGQCGQSNALVGLSRNFTQNNSRLNSGVDSQIRNVMPGMGKGEQVSSDFDPDPAFQEGTCLMLISGF